MDCKGIILMILIVLVGLFEGNDISQGCAVIISNNGPREKIMEIGARYAGKSFYDILKGVNEHIEIDKNGCGKFSVSKII